MLVNKNAGNYNPANFLNVKTMKLKCSKINHFTVTVSSADYNRKDFVTLHDSDCFPCLSRPGKLCHKILWLSTTSGDCANDNVVYERTFRRVLVQHVRWDLSDTSPHTARVCVSSTNTPSLRGKVPSTGRWQTLGPTSRWCRRCLDHRPGCRTHAAPSTCIRCRIYVRHNKLLQKNCVSVCVFMWYMIFFCIWKLVKRSGFENITRPHCAFFPFWNPGCATEESQQMLFHMPPSTHLVKVHCLSHWAITTTFQYLWKRANSKFLYRCLRRYSSTVRRRLSLSICVISSRHSFVATSHTSFHVLYNTTNHKAWLSQT